MKLAVTYENGQVFQHFGHCESFKIYDITDGNITSTEIVSAIGSGHGALAGFLQNHQVNALICGGIGMGARLALDEADIELYPGVSGDADEAVAAFLANTLNYNPDTVCNHHHDHDHEEGHECHCHDHEHHHEHDHECHHDHEHGHDCGCHNHH